MGLHMANIQLDAFYMDYALSGWVMGGPKNVQEWLVGHAQKEVRNMWGPDRPVLVVPPGALSNPRMCLAWLTGPSVEEGDASHLVVIWFQNGDPANPLEQAKQHVEAHGGWDKLAKGFWF